MYQALPYKAWDTTVSTTLPRPTPLLDPTANQPSTFLTERENLRSKVDENPVVVFGRRGCCMSHVVRRLLLELGVNTAVYEVSEQQEQAAITELQKLGPKDSDGSSAMSLPTVFIGGRLFGGLDKVIAMHITGELTPILREAKALWL